MKSAHIDTYVIQLVRELRKRGLGDARIVEEAREHLVDVVEDGLQRGLSVDEAERQAFVRFGAPETLAAHVAMERSRMMNRFANRLAAVWHRKWWILAPTLLTTVATSVTSYYFLPIRYRADASIRVVPQRVPPEYVDPTAADRSRARLQQISQSVLSRTPLERIIRDFDLYKAEQETAPLGDVVRHMRTDITVNTTSHDAQDHGVGGFNVSFVSSDPRLAMKVTERLASLYIEENLRDAQENAANLERRQLAEQFKVVDVPRMPERPVGPSRFGVNVVGAFAGFGLGLVLVGVSSAGRRRPEPEGN